MDFSTGYGKNAVDRFASNTTNTSLGSASPTEFFVGTSSFGQSTTEANLSKNYSGLWNLKALNLAFVGQFRVDKYELLRGDEHSYKVGPFATPQGKPQNLMVLELFPLQTKRTNRVLIPAA